MWNIETQTQKKDVEDVENVEMGDRVSRILGCGVWRLQVSENLRMVLRNAKREKAEFGRV
jgi:hypothetical protein